MAGYTHRNQEKAAEIDSSNTLNLEVGPEIASQELVAIVIHSLRHEEPHETRSYGKMVSRGLSSGHLTSGEISYQENWARFE